jgi:small conductance mechanosensitive channel
MPAGFRSLLEELSHLLARALSLGEAAGDLLARIGTIAGVLVLGWVGYRLVLLLIRRLLRPLEGATDYPARVQRARTLGPLLTSTVRYLVAFLVAVAVLRELGIDVRALLVSAGVVGLAIGLGAQSLIKDVITGFFILFENLIAVGDVVEVGQHTGVVESVGLRVTKIRKFSGELRIVPNGELTSFGHHTAGWARLVVEVAIDYDEEVGRALRILGEVGQALAETHPRAILEPPTAEGILRMEKAEAVLRLHARVRAADRFPLELEARRRIKEAFAEHGIRVARTLLAVQLDVPGGAAPGVPGRKESAA